MSSGAIDPITQTKRVFWRPVTEVTVIKVGQPVCYHSDSVLDHKDRDADPTHLGLTEDTYAEGAQDFTARLFCVEEPLAANLMSFAGIVKCLGPKAGADGDMIEIFVPNGAVVPCYIDASVTLDATVLGIRDGEADLSYPGRPIGLAKETIDRGTPGLCWVKVDPNMFTYQSGNANTGLTGCVMNTMQSTYVNTSGTVCNLLVHTTVSGVMTGGSTWGILNYMTITGASTGNMYHRGILSQVNIAAAIDGPAHISALYAQLTGSVEPANVEAMSAITAEVTVGKCSGATLGNVFTIIKMANQSEAEMGPQSAMMIYGGYGIEDLFYFQTCLNGGGADEHFIYPLGTGASKTIDSGAGATLKIKCRVDDTDYYLLLFEDPTEEA